MIAVIVKVRVKPSKHDDLKAAFETLKAGVLENEPDNLAYSLTKGRNDEDDEYTIIEMYKDAQAVKLHGKSEHFISGQPALKECLIQDPKIELFDALV